MDCPQCGEEDMIFYAGEHVDESDYHEPDAYGCPECGHMEVV